MSLVETDWLEENKHNVKIIDCSWHMPQTKRNGFEEYQNRHIPESIFFDLDDNSNKNTNLPHMLVSKNEWEKIVSDMGIKNQDKIITQLRAQKASYSGVSLDEEMTNLLKYERAYQAAAKVAQAVDEIMKTILQLV